MLIVLSPAKRLDLSTGPGPARTTPEFAALANRLAAHARALPLGRLKALMALSDDLARLNRDRFRAFADDPGPEATRAAVYAFAGDTYLGLEARSLDADTLDYAQDRLRILSGLYGVLRPFDAIQPHRLEMGSRLKTRRGGNLYDFWRDGPARTLNAAAAAIGTNVLINCASQEYFGAVDRRRLKLRVIEPVFMEETGGTARIVSFFAKKARGAMARFILERRIAGPEGMMDFDTGGYRYRPERSDGDRLVFIRDERAADAAQASFSEAS